MYEVINSQSPGAALLNEFIRYQRAVIRTTIIRRSQRLTLNERLRQIADKEGVIR